MSAAVDSNILVYAVDEKSPFHHKTREFLGRLFEEEPSIYLTWDTLHTLIRLVTNPQVFPEPLSPETAAAHARDMVEHPSVIMLGPSLESWNLLAKLIKELHIRGNLLPDAVTASILATNGIQTLYTNDRDFWKFPVLKPIDPFK